MAQFETSDPANVGEGAGIGGIRSKAEEQATVNQAMNAIVRLGFPEDIFDIDALLERGFTAKSWCDYCRAITSITERRDMSALLALGGTRFWELPIDATLENFIDFVKWIKSPEGRDAQTAAAKKRSLQKRAVGGLSTADVAIIQMGNSMIADYQKERKKARAPIEEQQRHLRRELRLLDDELAATELSVKERFGCIATYEGPDNHTVSREAYKLYLEYCRENRVRAIASHQGGFDKAVEMFGAKVRETHFRDYLLDATRAEFIRDYYNQKVLHLDRSGEKKQAGTFRNLVVAGCGEMALDAPPITTFIFDGEDSCGESAQSGSAAGEPAAKKKRGRPAGTGKAAARDKADKRPPKKRGDERNPAQPIPQGQEDQDTAALGDGSQPNDPNVNVPV